MTDEELERIGSSYEAKMDELDIFPYFPTEDLLALISSEMQKSET